MICNRCGTQFNGNTCPRCGLSVNQRNIPGNGPTAQPQQKKTSLLGSIIVGAVVFFLVFSLTKGCMSDSGSGDSGSGQSSVSEKVQKGHGTIRDYEVAFVSADYTETSLSGSILTVTLKFTNNSDTAASFSGCLNSCAYQNGQKLDTTFINDDVRDFNSDSAYKEVEPGETLTVQRYFCLLDTKSDVTVEITALLNLTKEKVVQVITLDD